MTANDSQTYSQQDATIQGRRNYGKYSFHQLLVPILFRMPAYRHKCLRASHRTTMERQHDPTALMLVLIELHQRLSTQLSATDIPTMRT